MFVFGCVLLVLGALFAFAFFMCAGDTFISGDEETICRIIGFFCVLIAIIGFVICNSTYEPPLCPECHTEVSANVRYCDGCGYELIPHCDGCGKVCETAFCSACGAKQ